MVAKDPDDDNAQQRRVDALIFNGGFHDSIVTAACKAHWPSWGHMRPEVERKWKQKMQAALIAAEKERAALADVWITS